MSIRELFRSSSLAVHCIATKARGPLAIKLAAVAARAVRVHQVEAARRQAPLRGVAALYQRRHRYPPQAGRAVAPRQSPARVVVQDRAAVVPVRQVVP